MSLSSVASAVAAVALPRFVARVDGERALAFLHDSTTGSLDGLTPGRGALTCYLDDKGRILAVLRVTVGTDGVLVDGDVAGRAAIVERLARIAPLSGCEIVELDHVVTALDGVAGPGDDEHDCTRTAEGLLVRTRYGADLIGEPVSAPRWDGFESARIAAGELRFGVDIAEGALVNETPLLARAVSFTKGCYPGQESVARVHNLGSIRRHHVLVAVGGPLADVPRALTLDGAEVGTLTSAADGRGIATVRSTVGPGDRLDADGIAATVERVLTGEPA